MSDTNAKVDTPEVVPPRLSDTQVQDAYQAAALATHTTPDFMRALTRELNTRLPATPEPPDSGDGAARIDVERLARVLIPLGGWAGHKAADVWREGSAYEVAKAIVAEYRAAAAPAEAREEGPTRRRARSDDYGYVLEGPAIFGEEAEDTDRAGGRG